MDTWSVIRQLLWQGERRRGIKAALVVMAMVAAGYALLLGAWFRACDGNACPRTDNLGPLPLRQTSHILAADGSLLARVGSERRTFMPLAEMSPVLKQAFLATEDRRFYRHDGVDYLRVLGAFGTNVVTGRLKEGGSTVTMQLARNLWPDAINGRSRTFTRKMREVQVAYRIEKRYTKDRILELYLNQIPLGGEIFGVEPAARSFFGKSAADLNVAEAALLAALPKGPSYYNPRRFPERARARRNLVIDLLRRDGHLTAGQAVAWKALPLGLRPAAEEPALAPYFVQYVRQLVERRFGEQLGVGGLRVHTTLDPAIQRTAERGLASQLDAIERGKFGRYSRASYRAYLESAPAGEHPGASPFLQGMVIVQEVRTGRILAMVGGRDFQTSKFNRAVQSRRQAGSAFKPFVYSAAVRHGDPLSRLVDDEPVTIRATRVGEPDWSPNNSDYAFQGAITIREALYRSRNAATVRLAMDLGLNHVIHEARQFGLTTQLPAYPSIVLGTAEVIPLELVSAYSAFANGGERTAPNPILRVEDAAGNILWEPAVQRSYVMDRAQAWLMTNALRDVVRRGTAYGAVTAAGFPYPSAGKTGTSDDYADNWYIGFTADIVTGVWIGMDRRQPIMAGAQGGKLAAPIWTTIMKEVYQHRPAPGEWLVPPGVSTLEIDRGTGYLFTAQCPPAARASEYFLFGTEPREYCPLHTMYAPAPLLTEASFEQTVP